MNNKDDFPTLLMTRRLIKAKVLKANNKEEEGRVNINKRSKNDSSSDEDADIWKLINLVDKSDHLKWINQY